MRGTVFIAPVEPVPDGAMVNPATGRFWCSWQDEGLGRSIEDVDVDGAEAAVEWGRERSETVLIRLGHGGDTYFSAGTARARDDDDPLPLWPPQAPPSDGWWEPPKVPSLQEIEQVASEAASGTRPLEDAATWAMDRMRPALEHDAPAAIRDGLFRLVDLVPFATPRMGVVEPEIRPTSSDDG